VQLRKQDGIELLKSVWLFERCTKNELKAIQGIATPLSVLAGTVLTRQGERGREFFVIVAGKAEATRGGVSIATLGPGSFFGEMALLDRKPRTATVTAIEATTVLVVTEQSFSALVETVPSVDRKMLAVLAERLRDIESRYVPINERVPSLDLA
jgi:CRP/FNR family transcriptional regulator, cyclic AMP receptor protein